MGASGSDLHHSLSRLPSLKNKPIEFKMELAQFVSLVSLDTPLPVKVDTKLFPQCLSLLQSEMKQKDSLDTHLVFQAIQRMFKIRTFYLECPKHDLTPFVDGLKSPDETVILSTLNCISWLLHCRVTPESNKEKEFNQTAREAAESAAKFAFFQNGGYDALCHLIIKYGKAKEYVGILGKVIDILSLDLVDHVNTTRFHILQKIVMKLTPHTNLILDLTTIQQQQQIRAFTIILLSGLMLHGPIKFCRAVQDKALRDGYLLYYMLFAISEKGLDTRVCSEYLNVWYHKSLPPLSRNLLGLLCSGHDGNRSAVLNLIPTALQGQMEDPIHKKSKIAAAKKDQKDAVTQTLFYHFQTNAIQRVNCDPLFANLDEEYKLPHFVWTHRMKGEMVTGILEEIDHFASQREVNPTQPWNWEAMDISHPYLEKYCRVGNFYVSILIPVLQDPQSAYPLKTELIHQLMSALFQRAVIEDDPSWKLGCLHAISVLYERYPDQFKEFLLIPYFIYVLDPVRSNPIWRDHILRFLQLVLKEPINAKRFVHFGGIPHLLFYINSIHTIQNPKSLVRPLETLSYLEAPPTATPNVINKKKKINKGKGGEEKEQKGENGEGEEEDEDEEEEEEDDGADEDNESDEKSDEKQQPGNNSKGENGEADGNSNEKDKESKTVRHSVSNSSSRSFPSLTASGVPAAAPTGKAVEEAIEIPHIEPTKGKKDKENKDKSSPAPPGSTLKVYKRERTDEELKWESSDAKEDLAGILPPELQSEEVCARSVRLLRIVSMASPKLRRTLGTLQVLHSLSRMLLCPILEIREDALKLLIDTLRSNLHLVPKLAETGFFIFSIAAMQNSFSDQLVEIINNTHMKQGKEFSPKGQSVLTPFLPSSLLKVLSEQGAAGLRSVFDGDVTLSPEIIWSSNMREELFDHTNEIISDFRKRLRKDPQAIFDIKSIKPIQFSSLQSELSVGGVYLRPLNEMGQKDLQSVRLKNPAQFVSEILKSLQSRKYNSQQILQLFLSLAITVHRYGNELPECKSFEGFPLLLASLDVLSESSSLLFGPSADFSSIEIQSEMLEKSSQVLNALLLLEGENAQKCFDSKGLDTISSVVQKIVSLPHHENENESEDGEGENETLNLSDISVQSSLVHLMACLRLMSRSHPPAIKHIESDFKLQRAMASLLSPPLLLLFPEISIASEQLYTSIIKSERIQEQFIRTGGFLDLVGIVAFYHQMSREQKTHHEESESDVHRETEASERENLIVQVRMSSLSILSILFSFSQSKSNDRVVKLFTAFFPSELCEFLLQNQLDSALKFIDTQWATGPKDKLYKYFNEQKIKIKEKKEWTEWIEENCTFHI